MHPAIRIAFFFVLIYCIIYAGSHRVVLQRLREESDSSLIKDWRRGTRPRLAGPEQTWQSESLTLATGD